MKFASSSMIFMLKNFAVIERFNYTVGFLISFYFIFGWSSWNSIFKIRTPRSFFISLFLFSSLLNPYTFCVWDSIRPNSTGHNLSRARECSRNRMVGLNGYLKPLTKSRNCFSIFHLYFFLYSASFDFLKSARSSILNIYFPLNR